MCTIFGAIFYSQFVVPQIDSTSVIEPYNPDLYDPQNSLQDSRSMLADFEQDEFDSPLTDTASACDNAVNTVDEFRAENYEDVIMDFAEDALDDSTAILDDQTKYTGSLEYVIKYYFDYNFKYTVLF